MAALKRSKAPHSPWITAIKIISVPIVSAVLLLVALLATAFVIAKGPASSESKRLCATFAEKRSSIAGLFFTAEQLEESLFYMPPKPVEYPIEMDEGAFVSGGSISYAEGKESSFIIVTDIAPSRLSLIKDNTGLSQNSVSVGLSGDVDAIIFGDYLKYRGEDEAIYCMVAMDGDGVLTVGAMNAYEAANSGYVWGIAADRVLVSGGTPAVSLGGGYASRAAIGQRADGSLILVYADADAFYPNGATHDELAALMYSLGAVNAASLKVDGTVRVADVHVCGERRVAPYSFVVMGGATQ